MNNRNSSLDGRTIRKRKINKNPGSIKDAVYVTKSVKRKRIDRGLDTRASRSEKKRARIKKMHQANPKNQKAIKYPTIGDKILVIDKKNLDLIFAEIKTLECRKDPLNYLKEGDILFLQETTKPNTIRGYVVFQGYLKFESQIHFQRLSNQHRVFDKRLEETNYQYGYRLSNPHEYDEVLKCESTGQQRKIIRLY